MRMIHYIATQKNQGILEAFDQYIGKSYQLIDYMESRNAKSIKTLLIVDPLLVNRKFVSISKTWRRYLFVHCKNAKLIILGKRVSEHPNYLDIGQLPDDFHKWLVEDAKSISDFEFRRKEVEGLDPETIIDHFEDSWEETLSLPGECIDLKLQQFFDGHGNVSLISRLIALRMTLVIAYNKVIANGVDHAKVYQEFIIPHKNEWDHFKNRWDTYRSYFNVLPFISEIEAIEKIISEIQLFFEKNIKSSEHFHQFKCHDKVKWVQEELKQIEPFSRIEFFCPHYIYK